MSDRITVKLIGEDRNAFTIMGKVSKALKAARKREEAVEYLEEAMKSDYTHLLMVTLKYVDVE